VRAKAGSLENRDCLAPKTLERQPPNRGFSFMATENIVIRRSEPDDYRAIHQIFAQPRAIWGTLQIPFPSAETWKKRLAEQPENLLVLVACVDGRVVGNVGLFVQDRPRRRHAAELGMAVHDEWQGRGVGSALIEAAIELADRWLNLARIELTVYTDNAHAIQLYEKFGFTIEGTLRRFAFRDGYFVDAHAMARLRPN
jgi:L-phenylalanine/L-methionine N-acetyltransferase